MFKSVLYYILMIAELCSTMFVGGIVMGIYLAFSGKLEEGNAHDQASFLKEGAPILYVFCILAILILWFTFSKAKFSKFTLGRVNPAHKWKAMFWYTIPLLGTTMTFIALFNFLGIDIYNKDIMPFGYMERLPMILIGSFISAYIIFGAIYEELIKCGKKTWVSYLAVLVFSIIPFIATSLGQSLTWIIMMMIWSIVQTSLLFYIYKTTRSTIVAFVACTICNLIPTDISNIPLCFAMGSFGFTLVTSSVGSYYGAKMSGRDTEYLLDE